MRRTSVNTKSTLLHSLQLRPTVPAAPVVADSSSASVVPLRAETVSQTARESQPWRVCLPEIPLPAMDRAPSFAPSAYELSSKGNESNPVTSYVSAAKAMVLPCNDDESQ